MDNSLIYGFVDQRDRREQEFRAHSFIAARYRSSKLLDRCAQFAAVAAVDLFSFGILPDPLLC